VVYDVDVQYLPICIGWATTVQSTQGLEFERVLLDLNRAGWLPGGAYSGIGRVKGDLRHGLRVIGGFSRDSSVFNCSAEVREWYRLRVLPAIS